IRACSSIPTGIRGRSPTTRAGRSRTTGRSASRSRLGLALERVEPIDDLRRVADERARVEDRVEVQLGGGLGQEIAEWCAGVPGALRRLLHDPVGLVARAVALHQ